MKTDLHGTLDYAKTLKLRFRIGDLDLPERRKRCASSREEEIAQLSCALVAKAIQSRIHMLGECEIYKEERDVFEMRKIDGCGIEKFGTRDVARKRPLSQEIDGDDRRRRRNWVRQANGFCHVWKKRVERRNVGGFSTRSMDGAVSKGMRGQ